MELGMNIAMDGIGLILLFLMSIDFGSRGLRDSDFAGRSFDWMLRINMGLLVTDMLSWLLMGNPSEVAKVSHRVTMFVYYLLQGPMSMCWSLYCDYMLTGSVKHVRKRLPILVFPVAVLLVMMIVNEFVPFVYRFTEDNHYQRMGGYGWVMMICVLYIVYSTMQTLWALKIDHRPGVRKRTKYLLLYPLFPALFAAIQTAAYGIAILWMGSVISLLIIYYNLQNRMITTDALTGVGNRQRFIRYFSYKLNNRDMSQYLFLMMLDIDRLKEINDKHGHLEGDAAIRRTAIQIRRGVRESDFVARISGDEFIVLGECRTESEVKDVVRSICDTLAESNRGERVQLSLSIGYAVVAPGETGVEDELLMRADDRMYSMKDRHHEVMDAG